MTSLGTFGAAVGFALLSVLFVYAAIACASMPERRRLDHAVSTLATACCLALGSAAALMSAVALLSAIEAVTR